ncbi:DNA-binding protein snt1 [Dimargaris verticillata]|uniref:DNA-binding protein snt1 n=1 Tax=Dimargaris verticillata TaxID=2761393 RepID=A0A9W8B8I4_9FUNG|nr:DNA-binding protein snt1 [Dimargaris verticillata]
MDPPPSYGAGASNRPPARSFSPRRPSRRPWSDSHHTNRAAPGPRSTTPYARDSPHGRFNPYRRGGSVAIVDRPQATLTDRTHPRRRHPSSPPPPPAQPSLALGRKLHSTASTGQSHASSRTSFHHDSLGPSARHYSSPITPTGNHHHSHQHRVDSYTPHRPLSPRSTDRPQRSYNRSHTASSGSIDRYVPSTAHPLSPKRRGPLSSAASPSHPSANGGNSSASSYRPSSRHRPGADRESDRWRPPSRQRPSFSPSSCTRDSLDAARRGPGAQSEKPKLGSTSSCTTPGEVTVHKPFDSHPNKDSWLPSSPEPLSPSSSKTSPSVATERAPEYRKPRPTLGTPINGSNRNGGPKSCAPLSANLPNFSLPPLSPARPSSAYSSSPSSGRSPPPNCQSNRPTKPASVIQTAKHQPADSPPSIPYVSEAQSKRKLSLSTTDRTHPESPRLDKRICSPRPSSPQPGPTSSPKPIAPSPLLSAGSQESAVPSNTSVSLAPGLAWTLPASKAVKVPVNFRQSPPSVASVSASALPLDSREPIPIVLPDTSPPVPIAPLSISLPKANAAMPTSALHSPPREPAASVSCADPPSQPSTPGTAAPPKVPEMKVDIPSPPADDDGLFVPPTDSELPWHRVYRDNQLRARKAHAMDLFGIDSYILSITAPRQVTDYPFYQTNLASHALMGPKLAKVIAQERQQTHHHEAVLKRQYKSWYKKWQAQLVKPPFESPRASPAVSDTSSRRDDLGLRTTPTNTRPSRRHGSGNAGLYSSDTVRSEAELMEIIQSLQHEQMHNPDFRSSRTAAVIPNMVLDPRKRLLLMYNNCNGLVTSPRAYYEIGQPLYHTSCGSWSLTESDIFIRRYFQYPKRFEKMASAIADKSATQCVLFYYRTKKQYRYKFLATSQGRSELRQARRMGLGLSQAAFVVGAASSQGKRIRGYLTREILEQELQRLNEMLGDFTTNPRQVCAKAKLANLPTSTVATTEPSQSGRQPIRRTRSKSSNATSRATTPVLRSRVTDNAMDTDSSPRSATGELPSDTDGASSKPLESPVLTCTCNTSPGHLPGCPMRARSRQRKSVSSPHERPVQPPVLTPVALRRRSSSRNSSANSEQLSRLASKSPAQLEPIAEHTLAASLSLDKPSEDHGLPSSDLGHHTDDGDGEELMRIRRLSTSTMGELDLSTSPPPPTPATIARWSDLDRILAVEGYRLYGRDFEAVSRMVRTKTEDQCRNYYHNYRRKYGPEAFKNPPDWFTKEKLTEAQAYVAKLYDSPQSITPTKSLPHPAFSDTDTPEPATMTTTVMPNIKAEPLDEASSMPMLAGPDPEAGLSSDTSMLAISNLTLQETTLASVPPPSAGVPSDLDANEPMPPAAPTDTQVEGQSVPTVNEPDPAKPTPVPSAPDTKPLIAGPVIPVPAVTPPVRKPHYSSYWSVAEKSYFLTYLAQVGKQWDKIAGLLKSKTAIQVRNYFNNNQERLRLDRIVEEWTNRQTQAPGQLGSTASGVQSASMALTVSAPEPNARPALSPVPPLTGQIALAEVTSNPTVRSTSISNLLTRDEPPAVSLPVAEKPAPSMPNAAQPAAAQAPLQRSPPMAPKVTKIDALLNSNMETDDPEEWKKQTMMDWFTAEPADRGDRATVTPSSAEPATIPVAARAYHGNNAIAEPLSYASRGASVTSQPSQPDPTPYPTVRHTPSLPPSSQAIALSAFSPAQRSPRASPYPMHHRPSASSTSSLGAPETRTGPAMPYHARPRSPAYPPSSLSIGSPSGSVHGSPHLGYQVVTVPGPPHTPYAPLPTGHDYTIRPPTSRPPSANRAYPPVGQFTPPPTTPAIPMGSFSPPREAHHMARPLLGPGAPAYSNASSPATPGQPQFPASSPGFPPYAAHHNVRRDSSGMTISVVPGSVGGMPPHHPHASHHLAYSPGLYHPPPGAPPGTSAPRPPSTPTSSMNAGGVAGPYPSYGYPPYPGGGGGPAPPPHAHVYPHDPHGRASYPLECGGAGNRGEYHPGPAPEAVPPSPHYPPPPAAYRGLPPPPATNHAPYAHQQPQQPAPGTAMTRYEYSGAYGTGSYPPPNSYPPRPPGGSGYPSHQ